jgi:hypothetical protein
MSIISEEEFFKKLSEKTSETIEDLKAQFELVLKEVKADEKFKGFTEQQYRDNARNRFGTRKMRESASNAISWEGIILGSGDLIDTVAKQKAATIAAFKIDPMKTVKGWKHNEILVKATADGVPVYPETDGNKRFGRANKPLPEHSWLRTLYFFARPIDPKTKQPGEPKLATMSLNDKFAIDVLSLPLMQKIKFKGINKTGDEDRKAGVYRINHSTFTKFEPIEITDMPPIEKLLPSLPLYKQLVQLDEYHNANAENKTRWTITEGSVTTLNLEPNAKTGNRYMIITDESLMFGGGDKTGVMCWIPGDRNIVIDFGQESRVFVVGKTNRGKARDPVTGDFLEGVPGDVSLNVYGIYAPEIFKVAPSLPVTESSVTPKPDEQKW